MQPSIWDKYVQGISLFIGGIIVFGLLFGLAPAIYFFLGISYLSGMALIIDYIKNQTKLKLWVKITIIILIFSMGFLCLIALILFVESFY